MPALEFDVNEVHTARYRVNQDAMTPAQWEHLISLPSDDAKAEYLHKLSLVFDFVDNSSELSHLLLDTLRNFDVVDC